MNTNMTRIFFLYLCVLVLWMKVASALEGFDSVTRGYDMLVSNFRAKTGYFSISI